MPERPRHPDKDLERILKTGEKLDWAVWRDRKCYKMRCPCGTHKRTVRPTPSGANYRNNLVAWLRRTGCWEGK